MNNEWEKRFENVLPLIVEDYNNFIAEAGEIGELDIEEIWSERMKPLVAGLLTEERKRVVEEVAAQIYAEISHEAQESFEAGKNSGLAHARGIVLDTLSPSSKGHE